MKKQVRELKQGADELSSAVTQLILQIKAKSESVQRRAWAGSSRTSAANHEPSADDMRPVGVRIASDYYFAPQLAPMIHKYIPILSAEDTNAAKVTA